MASPLTAVCAYFNSCGYSSRRINYDAFRRGIEAAGVRLLTVELVFDAQAESELGAASEVLCIRGGDVMWQKERLLQIGIDRLLAEGHDRIVWLDGDLLFGANDWPQRILRALDQFDCVQVFETLVSRYSEGQLRRPAGAKNLRFLTLMAAVGNGPRDRGRRAQLRPSAGRAHPDAGGRRGDGQRDFAVDVADLTLAYRRDLADPKKNDEAVESAYQGGYAQASRTRLLSLARSSFAFVSAAGAASVTQIEQVAAAKRTSTRASAPPGTTGPGSPDFSGSAIGKF